MAQIVQLTDVRISFPALTEPELPKGSQPGATPRYGADFLMDPQGAQFQKVWAAIQAVAVEKWKEHAQTVLGMIQPDRKLRCYGMGTERIDSKTFKPYNGYEGQAYLSASNTDPMQIFDQNGQEVDLRNTMVWKSLAGKIYGGCYVNVAIEIWAQENAHGRGIRAKLLGIQFLRDGEAFGEAAPDISGLFGQVPGAQAASPAGAAFPVGGAPAFGAAPVAMPGAPSFGAPAPAAAPTQGGMPGAPAFGAPAAAPQFPGASPVPAVGQPWMPPQ